MVDHSASSKRAAVIEPGIGLDAQQAAIAAFAKAEVYDLVETFSGVETGERSDALEKRPQWPQR